VKHKNFVEMIKMFTPDREFAQAVIDVGVEITSGIGCRKHLLWRNLTLSIHKQHPDRYYNAAQMRYYGKDLTNTFGWRREAFVVR
jgi:hypothetical protein